MAKLVLFLSFCHCMYLVWGESTTASATTVKLSSAFTTPSTTTTPEVPSNVSAVWVINRTVTEITLVWDKVNNRSDYTYRLNFDQKNISINGSGDDLKVTYTVSSLTSGTEYNFTLYTVLKNVESKGFQFTNFTVPSNVDSVVVINRTETEITLEWNKVNKTSDYRLNYDGKILNISGSEGSSVVTYTVSSLTSGTEYNFTLYTLFKDVESTGLNFTNVTVPSNVGHVAVINRTETEITLVWEKVNMSSDYRLNYDGGNLNISGSGGSSEVTYNVSSLTSGTQYTFTLYTVFKDVESTGFNFTDITVPSNVKSVSVKFCNETAITLEWSKVSDKSYDYRLTYDENNFNINGSVVGSAVTHTVSPLAAGTKYSFTLYTVFQDLESRGFIFTKVTAPSNVKNVTLTERNPTTLTLEWNKIRSNNSSNYNYSLSYNGTDTNISGSVEGSVVTHKVLNLSPGATYNFTLYTVLENVNSSGLSFTEITMPERVHLRCEYSHGGYGLTLIWDLPKSGTVVQVNISDKNYNTTKERMSITGLQPARWYTLTVAAVYSYVMSESNVINCQTDPRGVIGGVLVVLLLVCIICIVIFIWRRKKKQPSALVDSKPPVNPNVLPDKYTLIPLKKFPEHFSSLSCDENRGFSEEYEDLGRVGKDQSCSAALLPENKSKNRFINVLAYDSSRVRLAVQTVDNSDYINANYMPGYGSNSKQYIAAQGPLPTTITDFWRMVWEQNSPAIIMLTNCIEGGKVKCEQYWPLDITPCVYGNFEVTVQSEHRENSWTLREFVIRNTTSEERTVTHFHFTAWPDHGVPKGTEDLIRFRGIVRTHIESFQNTGPTVVHCSAGVGRTGTLIALDTLLQQLEKEEAVNITACVHRMRLNRPLMVQTESQYVFLHQCIMDSIQPKEHINSEPIYENSDMIYTNAMALQQYNPSKTSV